MRIGIDCRLWNETGVGRYIRNLIKNLQIIDKGNEYTLFVLSKDYQNIKYQISNIKNRKWKTIIADVRWHTIEEQLKFPMILKRENLDLVHFPYISVPIFYSKPFVVTIHDLIVNHFPTGQASTLPRPIYDLKRLGYKFVISQAAKKTKKIITVSNVTKEEIVDHLGVNRDKVVVIYEGVDEKISNLKSQISNPQLKSKKYFLYVGNAYPHKNLERLVEAFKVLAADASLVLVGREDYFYKRLKRKVREINLLDKVIFLGNVTDEELADLYKNALALIIPSLMEGFGLPALEAMANKCLVLASNIPALREVCGDVAIYFDPYNVEELFTKMKEIYSNDMYHYSDKIKKGLERSKKFSWEKMAKETLKVYKKVASNP